MVGGDGVLVRLKVNSMRWFRPGCATIECAFIIVCKEYIFHCDYLTTKLFVTGAGVILKFNLV